MHGFVIWPSRCFWVSSEAIELIQRPRNMNRIGAYTECYGTRKLTWAFDDLLRRQHNCIICWRWHGYMHLTQHFLRVLSPSLMHLCVPRKAGQLSKFPASGLRAGIMPSPALLVRFTMPCGRIDRWGIENSHSGGKAYLRRSMRQGNWCAVYNMPIIRTILSEFPTTQLIRVREIHSLCVIGWIWCSVQVFYEARFMTGYRWAGRKEDCWSKLFGGTR